MEAGVRLRLATPPLVLHGDPLEFCSAPRRAELRVRIHPGPSVDVTREIAVLPGWSWSYQHGSVWTLAAFVSPEHALIEKIARQAHERLRSQVNLPSLKALVHSERKDAARLVFEALYQYLKEDCVLHWCPPEATQGYQNIKPLHRILSLSAAGPEGEATCIDLALLIAGCLENAGLLPVIVLTGRDNEPPSHALAGCWTGSLPTGRAMIREREFLRRQTQEGNLLLIECTAFVEGPDTGGGKLDFVQAMRSAETQLTKEPEVCAIDVGALRPPYGLVTPMNCPLAPVVKRAFLEAKQLARDKRRELVETIFLLYGCLTARGEILLWLFQEAGLDPDEIRTGIADLIGVKSFSGEPSATQRYRECQHWARQIASLAGAASIDEPHLLWALLNQGRESGRFCDICHRLGVDLDRLEKTLAGRYPAPPTLRSLGQSVSE
jgi:hypothetical protein